MEWVETTAKSVEEAKNAALDALGVAEDDAEFEILEEPTQGLFGRTRGEARVRARVRPTQARPKTERRTRRTAKPDGDKTTRSDGDKPAGEDRPERSGAPRARSNDRPRQSASEGNRRPPREPRRDDDRPPSEPVDPAIVGEQAVKFLTGVVNAFGLTGAVSMQREGEELEAQINGDDLGLLVGPRGNTLLALQDLTRVVAQRRLGDHETRLRVDVAGYRERRRDALTRFAVKVAAEVVESGQPRVLEPMASADRKVVHDALAEQVGVVTRSRGDDPYRQIVVEPAAGE